jgi:hypothetical protein
MFRELVRITIASSGAFLQITQCEGWVPGYEREAKLGTSLELVLGVGQDFSTVKVSDAPSALLPGPGLALMSTSASISISDPKIDPALVRAQPLWQNANGLPLENPKEEVGPPVALIFVAEFLGASSWFQ